MLRYLSKFVCLVFIGELLIYICFQQVYAEEYSIQSDDSISSQHEITFEDLLLKSCEERYHTLFGTVPEDLYLFYFEDGIAVVNFTPQDVQNGVIYYSMENNDFIYVCHDGYGTVFCQGFAACCTNGTCFVINKDGMILKQYTNAVLENATLTRECVFTFSTSGGNYFIVDMDSGKRIDLTFDILSLQEFCNDRAAYCAPDGLWGYIDRLGKISVPPRFTACRNFFEGFAVTFSENECNIINPGGEVINKEPLIDAFGFSEGLCGCVTPDDKVGFMNQQGEWVFEPQFDYDGTISFLNGTAYAYINDRYYQLYVDGRMQSIDEDTYDTMMYD